MEQRLKLLEHQLAVSKALFTDLKDGKAKERIGEEIFNISFEIESIRHETQKGAYMIS